MKIDPRYMRLSEHFLLSDFLGNHSVYSRGFANDFEVSNGDPRIDNGAALCQEALEPILERFGPLSIAYGAIGPRLSDQIVKYQDPRKPSHHLWNLGAAADICVHKWVSGSFPTIMDLYAPLSAMGSPISLAHAIDYLDIPYSRMITYSESPFICLAVSGKEVDAGNPRKAFYENRYQGKAKAKPDYRQYGTQQAKQRALELLQEHGLEHPWQGDGYPTYHGGGFRQYQHMRVSKYTMVSDWLFDLKSISRGVKNIPSMNNPAVQDAFAAAGIIYDWLIETLQVKRLSIVAGYVSPLNPSFDAGNDWRTGTIKFTVAIPASYAARDAVPVTNRRLPWTYVETRVKDDFLEVTLSVDDVLESIDFDTEIDANTVE